MSAQAQGGNLPPGPSWPRLIQTLAFLVDAPRFLGWVHRRYGGAATLRTLFDSRFVMLFDPELVRQLFRGPHEQLRAGEANAMLGRILGERSILVLDGDEHLRHRRMMLPPFHGAALRAVRSEILAAADDEIDSWPVGEPFALLPSMQQLTLRVMMRAVFGERGPAQETETARRIRALIQPLSSPRGMLLLALLPQVRKGAAEEFADARRAVDEDLHALIRQRRADPALSSREDVFSGLLQLVDERGEPLSDAEVRDELLTLLIAGHETTATGLAFAVDLLLHDRRVLERARDGDAAYLDAVAKEALRLAPVIPGVGRVVRQEPFRLGEFTVPVGVEINPSIRMIHHSPELYPQPTAFRPERFLGDDPPDTYTWLPFGGGTRRCLGASMAMTEMSIVLGRILERADLRAELPRRDKVVLRTITLSPKQGVLVRQDVPPRPGAPLRETAEAGIRV